MQVRRKLDESRRDEARSIALRKVDSEQLQVSVRAFLRKKCENEV
jgi:hypothetical protein